jgi:Immunity protein 52
MDITLIFPLHQDRLPSPEEHLCHLWKVAKLLEPFGLPIESWYPPAATPKKSRENPAFDRTGPTLTALQLLRTQDEKMATTNYRRTGVWTGKEKGRGGVYTLSFSSDEHNPICVFNLQFAELDALHDARTMVRFVLDLLDIWPAATKIEVGPLIYYLKQQVFPNRPGAGWMLYLARAITPKELPEAAELVPVIEGGKQKGTIIVSVMGEVFSADNSEHVKIANAIEVRLADQDLLPR